MAGSIPWVLILVAILILVLGVVAFLATKKKKRSVDYYSFFVMGVIWTIFGAISLVTKIYDLEFFFIMGLVFMAIGLVHKDKWKKNRKTLKDMDPKQRKIIIISIIMGVLVLLGLIVFYLFEKGVI